jgi:hypothetical protein
LVDHLSKVKYKVQKKQEPTKKLEEQKQIYLVVALVTFILIKTENNYPHDRKTGENRKGVGYLRGCFKNLENLRTGNPVA